MIYLDEAPLTYVHTSGVEGIVEKLIGNFLQQCVGLSAIFTREGDVTTVFHVWLISANSKFPKEFILGNGVITLFDISLKKKSEQVLCMSAEPVTRDELAQ